MTRRATLRASDADRERVAERLRHAATEGRLSADELDQRLGIALSARTYGELDTVLTDLPGGDLAVPAGRAPARRSSAVPVAVLVAAVLVVTGAVALAVGGHAHPGHGGPGPGGIGSVIWLVWLALGWRYFTRRRRRSG